MSRSKRYADYRKAVTKHTVMSITEAEEIRVDPGIWDHDHLIPKQFGFKNDIPPELIGSIDNIQIMRRNENIQKGTRITPKGIDLLRKWGYEDLADVYEARIAA